MPSELGAISTPSVEPSSGASFTSGSKKALEIRGMDQHRDKRAASSANSPRGKLVCHMSAQLCHRVRSLRTSRCSFERRPAGARLRIVPMKALYGSFES